jgi:hypothetical protein
MDENFTEAYIKNALKTLGIQDMDYDFINLSTLIRAFGHRFSIAWQSSLLAAVLCLILFSGKKLIALLRALRERMSEMYFRELCGQYRKDLAKTAGWLVVITTGIAGSLAISPQILSESLKLREISTITATFAVETFNHRLQWLLNRQLADKGLLWACILLIIGGAACYGKSELV